MMLSLSRNLSIFLFILCGLFSAIPQVVEAEPRAFRFGISCPLSGVLAEYGTAVRNGVEMARLENPQAFSNIEIFFEDSQWDPKVAVSAFRALKAGRQVDLVYNWGNPTSEAVAPIAEQGRVPTIVMSSDPAIAANKRFITRSINSAAQLGALAADDIGRRGYKSVGIIVADNSYLNGVVEGIQSSLNGRAKLDIIERVPLETQDFRSVIARIKSRGCDIIGALLISGQVSSFYKQMKTQGVNLPSFGADFLDSPSELAAAGSAVEGAFHPNFDVMEDFRARYLAKYGNDVQIPFAANAFDVANIVAGLFGTAALREIPSGEVIVDKIRSTSEHVGANGALSVRRGPLGDYYFHYPLVIKEARGGCSVKR
jgi:ABC-type branched-subunit amino acid transport system substrate-binding protein